MTDGKVPWIRVFSLAVAGAMSVWLFQGLLDLAYHKSFSMDECTYLHAGWMIAHGYRPFVDFILFFFGIGQVAALPCLLAGNNVDAILAMRLFHVLFIGLMGLAAWRINAKAGPIAGPLAVAIMFSMWSFVQYDIEVRPDGVALSFFLASLAFLYEERLTPFRRSALCGAFYAASAWMTPKGFVCGWVFFAALLIDGIVRRRKFDEYVIHPGGFVVGGAAIAVGLVAVLGAQGSLRGLRDISIPYAQAHEQYFTHYPWRRLFTKFFSGTRPLFALAAVAAVDIVFRCGRERRLEPDAVLAGAAATSFYSYMIQHGALSYSWLPFAAVLSILAVRGLRTIVDVLRAATVRWPKLRLTIEPAVLAAAGAVAVLAATDAISSLNQRTNDYQLSVISKICDLTLPTDKLYDNSSQYVVRPNACLYYFNDRVLKMLRHDTLKWDVPQEIINARCKGWTYDRRHSDLPSRLKHFLHDNFVTYNGDVWLVGRSFRPEESSGTFLALDDGRYFVEPAVQAVRQNVRVDGRPFKDGMIYLKAGPHQVTYKPVDRFWFYLLWLPRDNKRWVPHDFAATFWEYTTPL